MDRLEALGVASAGRILSDYILLVRMRDGAVAEIRAPARVDWGVEPPAPLTSWLRELAGDPSRGGEGGVNAMWASLKCGEEGSGSGSGSGSGGGAGGA
ncbi:hypothetical protein [Thermocladium modestius]|uniref:hypothetical protein n=1 Tax=Thermocladium modestius TaxID=62609 RepID=UPI00166E3D28|nr:hypothetical protein [Thermocladium modestius]